MKELWENILRVGQTAASFLRSDEAPPGSSEEEAERLKNINHLSSKKFFITAAAVTILVFFYFSSVFILFLTASVPVIIPGFVTIFSETVKILAIIIASFLGVQTIADFSYKSNSNVNYEGKNEFIKNETTIDEGRSRPDYEEED